MKIKVKEMLKDNYSLYYSVDYKNKTNNTRENKVAIDYLVYEILEKEKSNNIDKLLVNIKKNYLKRKGIKILERRESEENEL